MNICIIHSAEEKNLFPRQNFSSALLSYRAEKNILLAENLSPDTHGDIMVISADDIGENITPAIYDECRRRGYRAVFLDVENEHHENFTVLSSVSESLLRHGLSVFCPLTLSRACQGSIPVAEASSSGGILSDYIFYLAKSNKRLALSIPVTRIVFPMPVINDNCGHPLSQRELRRITEIYGATPFFSPQMLTNYFVYSPAPNEAEFVLFDNAQTISEKIRLAKRTGVSDIFLTYREIEDIADDIVF